jgi:cold shock protein
VATGTVAWFNADKGYGMLAVDGGTQVFVEYDAIEADGFRTLRKGQRVAFEITRDARGPLAAAVRATT